MFLDSETFQDIQLRLNNTSPEDNETFITNARRDMRLLIQEIYSLREALESAWSGSKKTLDDMNDSIKHYQVRLLNLSHVVSVHFSRGDEMYLATCKCGWFEASDSKLVSESDARDHMEDKLKEIINEF